MEKKNPSPKSHLELLIPNKKQAKQKENAIPHGFTEEELIRNEAWHGKKAEVVQATTEAHSKQKGTVHSLEEARARKEASELKELDASITTSLAVLVKGFEQVGEEGTTPWPADQARVAMESLTQLLQRKMTLEQKVGHVDAAADIQGRITGIETILNTLPHDGVVDPVALEQLRGLFESAEQPPVEEEKKLTAAELREAREQEEAQIKEIAQGIFEARMRGEAAEEIDKRLVEQGIKPWTPDAEEFMRKWDWEQAEHTFAVLANNRQEAVLAANEPEPNKRVELQEQQANHINEKFAAFNINPDVLPQELKEEFDTLTYGQRLLLAENLQQLTLGRVQEEAHDRYQQALSQETLLKSKLLGRFWQGVSKKYQIAKHEQNTARDIKQGGLAYHGELLKQLIDGTKRTGLDAIEGKDGMLELQYIEAHPMMTEREKEGVKEFNRIATLYSKIPYEWSLATATTAQKKEYERVHAQFEKAKEVNLMTEQGLIGDKQALLFVAEMENKIRLNQFFNTHPDAEKQLQSIENDAILQKAIANVATERGLYNTAGVAAKTFATSLLGAVGFPLAAVGVGGWMARRRAAETLREREKAGRRGTKDTSKEAITMVTADSLSKKIDDLVQKINSEEDAVKREALLASLQVRLEYTQNKLGKGAVDFGSSDRRILNQYGLMDALTVGSSTFVAQETVKESNSDDPKREDEIRKRLDYILQSKDTKTTKAQKDYLRKQMIYGAGLGIGAFAAGFFAEDVLGAGVGEAHASTGDAESIMKGYAPKGPRGPQMVPAHESTAFGVGAGRTGATETAFHRALETATTQQEHAPIVLDIGTRGPEGAFIDELRQHPEIAERLGIKDVGKEAHAAWLEFAKVKLKDPETQKLLENLGYPKTQAGYGEMMRHIEHGKIVLEEQGGKLHMRIADDTKYSQFRPKAPVIPKASVGPEVGISNDVPTGQQIMGGAPVPEAAMPSIDVDKASREAPLEGIVSPVSHIEKPTISIETLIDDRFGMDAGEYRAIGDTPVEKLLKQIPSRDEAWAIWRGEVPGSEITLPHDGIYGAMEFKKHIDLAEYIRGKQPNADAMHKTVSEFVRDAYKEDGFNLSEAGKPGTVETLSAQAHPGGDAVAPAMPHTAAERVAPPVVETQPTPSVATVEDVPAGQQIMGGASQIEGLAPERMELLREDVYNSKMPVQKILMQYKVGNIAPEDFMRYYTQKVANVKPSPEMLSNIKTTFSHAAGEGTPQQRLMAQRALDLFVKRIQANK